MNRRKFLTLGAGVLVAAVVPVEVFVEALPAYRAPIAAVFDSALRGDLYTWKGVIAFAPLGESYWWVRQGGEWRRMNAPEIDWPYGEPS